MNYEEFRAALLEIDPHATEYYRMDDGAETYTVLIPMSERWELSNDGIEDSVLSIQVNHYSRERDIQFLEAFARRFVGTTVSVDDPVRIWDKDTGLHVLKIACLI